MSEMGVKKETELKILAKDFAANGISAAGISYIVTEQSTIRRAMWFVGVMGTMAFMGYMTINVILEYLSYPKVLIKEDAIRYKLPFPAVTICSLNPISSHHVSETSLRKLLRLKEMMQEATAEQFNRNERDQCYVNPLCKWSWFQERCYCVQNPCLTEFCLAENSSHCSCSTFFCNSPIKRVKGCEMKPMSSTPFMSETCLCKGTSTQDSWDSNWPHDDSQGLLDTIEDKEVKEIIRLIKHSKTYDLVDVEEALMPSTYELYQFGVTFDSLVAACTFEGVHCYRENFTVLYHPNYGKCYMFNYVGNNVSDIESPIEIDRYGSTSGLQLLLRVSDNNDLDLLRREVGARIVVHDPHMLPFVSEYGVNVRPRDMTAVELSLSNITRLGKPWGTCEEGTSSQDTDKNVDPYSILACEKHCGYKHLIKNCNCTMRHFLRGTVLNTMAPGIRFCNLSNKKERDCVKKISADVESKLECDCKPPCRETIYSYTVTSSELNENYYRTVKAIRTLKLDSEGKKKYVNYSDE
ncbi:amiloride-sensitive sodium channel subunit alpha-like [Argiope bruennichi]|uniref:amiloride-sensitive sodium channel subunit alpha-like n=1 Tax=Argiope bruennichi TaxID=94029 RepID=UPI00249587A5|nr:amiloride-sensitive sodium channel subunit alpha-like [Argiope bruennichi]